MDGASQSVSRRPRAEHESGARTPRVRVAGIDRRPDSWSREAAAPVVLGSERRRGLLRPLTRSGSPPAPSTTAALLPAVRFLGIPVALRVVLVVGRAVAAVLEPFLSRPRGDARRRPRLRPRDPGAAQKRA